MVTAALGLLSNVATAQTTFPGSGTGPIPDANVGGTFGAPLNVTSLAPASRWTALTHSGAGNNSAPHADSRGMAFDAAGELIKVDDGGVYKRGAALAAPEYAPQHQARLVQGTFDSSSDQQSFQRALAKAFQGEVRISAENVAAGDGAPGDEFGYSVAVSGDTALVAAYLDDTLAGADAGSAYVFTRSGAAWSLQAKLTAGDGAPSDRFGSSVALSGDTALVGAYDGPQTGDTGSAYVFTRSGTAWSQQAKLTASDGAANDLFGSSVALFGDTALVGAYDDDTQGGVDAGSAYVFTRSGTAWSQQAKLTVFDGAAGDRFGVSVALLSGDTALVGAFGDDTSAGENAGSVYLFSRSGEAWNNIQQLTADDAAAGDLFGSSIVVSGFYALVGAPADDTLAGVDAGSAYVFVRGAGYSQQAKLTASDGAAFDRFGTSVALSGDTALVGSNLLDSLVGVNSDSAYVFTRNGAAWSQQAKLTAGIGATGDKFGYSVALSGDTALVGAHFDDTPAGFDAGSAYVFTRSVTAWSPQAKLTAGGDGLADARFGYSVALSGDTALVGTPFANTATGRVGLAYIFTRSGTQWLQQAKLSAADGAAGDEFGISVALSGDTALVGSRIGDAPIGPNAGSAYVFTRSGTQWSQQAKLTAGDGALGDQFGISVALSGDTALVGANRDDSPSVDAGSAYVFTRTGTAWSQQLKLTAADGAAGDEFGISVALSGDTALVGAFLDDTPAGVNAGSAYVFTRSGVAWSLQAKLLGSSRFGYSVALSGDTALVGARFGTSPYVFTRSGALWSEQARLTATDGVRDFSSVALSGDTALVGAFADNTPAGTNAGSAYIFTRSGTTWSQRAKLTASDGAPGDQFGISVALFGNTALVGAYGDDGAVTGNLNLGSAYFYTDNPIIFIDGFESVP